MYGSVFSICVPGELALEKKQSGYTRYLGSSSAWQPPLPGFAVGGLWENEKMEKELLGFDEFWAVYPRKVAKLAAKRMYARALKLTTPEAILEATRKYANEREGKDIQFTAHAATWLNAGRWDDYLPATSDAPRTAPTGFYAAFCSAELDAWNAYGRKTKGLNYPADKRGGWTFPTRWPPGHDGYDAQDDFAKSLEEGYRHIRERQANGGPGWILK